MEEGQSFTANSSAIRSSSRKPYSDVWKVFDKFTEGGKLKAKCNKCGQIYNCGGIGTSSLKRHIANLCPFRDALGYEGQVVEFDQLVFRDKLAKAMMKHNYPYRFCEHEGIRDVFSYLNPSVIHVSLNTAKSDMNKIYQTEKEILKVGLDSNRSRICLTSDLWKSIVTNGYMTVTAHYVDNNWILQKRVLVFRHLSPPHDGQNVGEKLISYLKEWGIERKIFTLTLDNATYNNGVVDSIKNHISMMNASICDGSFLHVRCAAHILNLIVQACLKIIEVCIEKIRDSVKYVRGSETRAFKFAMCVKQLGLDSKRRLSQDMPVRWNSTYKMLDSALFYRRAFCQLNLVDPNYKWCPTFDEWTKVAKIIRFLKPFFELTELFSGQHYPTSNLYFRYVWQIQIHIQEEITSEDPDMRTMAIEMKPKFDKYWKDYSSVLIFAMVLDPRYKFEFVNFCYEKLDPNTSYQKVWELKEQMRLLFEDYLCATPSRSESFSNASSTIKDDPDIAMEEFDSYLETRRNVTSQSQLQSYLDEAPVDRKKNPHLDILMYWRGNSVRYPQLAMMARDILSVPITTVASESVFSHGGRIIGKFNSSILPSNAEASLCGRDWIEAYDSEDEEEKDLSIDIEKLIAQINSAHIRERSQVEGIKEERVV